MCDDRERLIGYVYDECDAGERRTIEAHLESCEACREEIAALRGVRTDLLAWDVPDHGSVWTPFVKTRPVVWWRQVPAWGLAAAASLMLLAGAAGGAVTRFAMVSAAPAVAPATAMPDLGSMEKRITDNMRSEIAAVDARVRLVAAHQTQTPAPTVDEAQLMRRVTELVDAREQRQFEAVKAVNKDLYHVTNATNARMAELESSVNQLKTLISMSNGGGSK